MSPTVAAVVVQVIAAVALIVWLLALRSILAATRAHRTGREPADGRPAELEGHRAVIEDSVELDGAVDALASRAASSLARGGPPLGPFRIVDRSAGRIAFEGTPQGTSRIAVGSGELRLEGLASGRVRATWWLRLERAERALIAAQVVQLVGLVAILCGYWAVMTWVVASPTPGVRGQSFQFFQVGHLLWPPFLFAHRYKKMLITVREGFRTLVCNLPFLDD